MQFTASQIAIIINGKIEGDANAVRFIVWKN